jgi:hypothetical protein
MDKQEYLNSLKNTELRPGEITIERKQEILLEEEEEQIGKEDEMEKEEKQKDPRGASDLHQKIIKWFIENPYPDDNLIHGLAEKLGMDPEGFEKEVYAVLSSFISEGYSKGKDVKHDTNELKMGIEVEYEHSTNQLISRKIAMDHLVEIPDYYTRLKRMEEEAEDFWSSKNDERTEN